MQPAEIFPCSPQHPRKELHSLPAAWQHACFLGHKARQAKCFPKGRFHGQKHFPRASSLWEWLLQPLLCWTMSHSIPRQCGQCSAQLKGISPGHSPCSFCYCKISPSCLLCFELMTVCPLSLLPRGNWGVILFSVLLQNRDPGCDTIWGVHVAPHQCLPTATLGQKTLSASFYPSSGNSGLTHQLPVSRSLEQQQDVDVLKRDWASPKHPQLATASHLSRGVSYTPGSFCAGKARKEKVNISVPVGVAK